ncbi:Outer spore wall assembly protein SHE10 [Nakaseomyces bracarensis]|uniref:Outer spore wall assembly protein SHE10 n=1 Tax=Nakaseomyces bracarensis TaxID=273131 RepID=A0ABR4NNL3_9SACH
MKFFTKFLVFLAAVWLGLKYACESSLVEHPQLRLACHYSQPAVWNEYLMGNEVYKKSVYPQLVVAKGKYDEFVEPHVSKVCEQAHAQWDRIDKEKYCNLAQKYGAIACERIQFYYNIGVRPHVDRVLNSEFYNKNLKKYGDRAKEDLLKAYNLAFVTIPNVFRKENVDKFITTASSMVNQQTDAVKKQINKATTKIAEEAQRVQESLKDEPEEVVTSTVVKTITQTQFSSAAATEAKEVEEAEVKDVEIDHQVQLQRDFDKWSKNVAKKFKMVNKMLLRDVKKQLKPELDSREQLFAQKIKELSHEAESNFEVISKAIEDINCIEGEDPTTGETIYFDAEGQNQIEQYITREMIREMLNNTQTTLSTITEDIQGDIKSIMEVFKKISERSRDEHCTAFEEWGDIMISEWSKKLAYLDVLATHEDDSESEAGAQNEVSEKNWKKFMEIKKKIVSARDKLGTKQIKIKELKTLLDNIQKTLQALTNEHGEYLYILRAKANLAFQEREAKEREVKEAPNTADGIASPQAEAEAELEETPKTESQVPSEDNSNASEESASNEAKKESEFVNHQDQDQQHFDVNE